MSTPTFERTAPVFAGRKIVIAIDSDNPLSTQLTMITGDGWNSIDWTDTLKTGEITHKKSGLVVKVLPAMSRYNALLHDIMRLHSTPDNGEYRGCEAEPCAWCEEAKKLTSETVRSLEDTMPTSDANIRQSAEHQKLIADGWKLRGWCSSLLLS